MTRWITRSTLREYINLRVYDFESVNREIEQLKTPEYSRVVNRVIQFNLDKIREKYNQYKKIPLRRIIHDKNEVKPNIQNQNLKRKDLEAQGCKVFVCPNLKLIDARSKYLNLQDTTLQKAKDIAREYFKKTYHHPKYRSVIPVLAACLHMASVIENRPPDYSERRTQTSIINSFGLSSTSAIRKWFYEIRDELCIDVSLE